MKTPPEVPRITDAPAPHAQDIKARMIKYSISMSVRLLCLVGAVLLHDWLRWVAIAGAIVLPYFAVVIANAGREPRAAPAETLMDPAVQRALRDAREDEPGRSDGPGAPGPGGFGGDASTTPKAGDPRGEVIPGEVVDDERL